MVDFVNPHDIVNGLIAILTWQTALAMLVGTTIGIVLSAMPGLSTTMVIALAIPFTYSLDPLPALGLLAGIHNGASQGAAIPAILLRIPGHAGAIATAWDGYPLTQKGLAAPAIQLSAVSAAVGGMISALSLILLAPPLAKAALAFGPAEIFWVNVFGLASISALLGNDMLKGIIASCFGLLIGAVGLDNVTAAERYTFGFLELQGGIPQVAVLVGMFSLPPAWELAERIKDGGGLGNLTFKMRSSKGVWSVREVFRPWMKSSFIGVINGILPGSAIAAFIAYNEAKRSSKTPEKFGKGSPEGLAAAECVNTADNAAAMIPTLTLGVPGSNVAALMLGALLIQGFQPGPQLFRNNPEIVYGYSWQMFITSALLVVLGGAFASRFFAQVLRLPRHMLLPLIVALTVAGAFASENEMYPVYETVIFGLVGLAMIRFDFPIAPVVIGLVLGAKAEFSLRIALLISQGSYEIFFRTAISWTLIALTILVFAYPLIRQFKDARKAREAVAQATDPRGQDD